MLKLAIDIDNVILNTSATIINLYNKLNENKIEYNDDIKLGWKFEPIIKTEKELAELFKLFDHKDFYNDAITYDNAIEVINTLSMQNEITIISKHMKSRKPLTMEWIYRVFPSVNLVFVDNFEDKGKELEGYNVILDDRIDALESCKEFVNHCVCFNTYKWNSMWNGLRIANWLEFKQLIDKLENLDKNKLKD